MLQVLVFSRQTADCRSLIRVPEFLDLVLSIVQPVHHPFVVLHQLFNLLLQFLILLFSRANRGVYFRGSLSLFEYFFIVLFQHLHLLFEILILTNQAIVVAQLGQPFLFFVQNLDHFLTIVLELLDVSLQLLVLLQDSHIATEQLLFLIQFLHHLQVVLLQSLHLFQQFLVLLLQHLVVAYRGQVVAHRQIMFLFQISVYQFLLERFGGKDRHARTLHHVQADDGLFLFLVLLIEDLVILDKELAGRLERQVVQSLLLQIHYLLQLHFVYLLLGDYFMQSSHSAPDFVANQLSLRLSQLFYLHQQIVGNDVCLVCLK